MVLRLSTFPLDVGNVTLTGISLSTVVSITAADTVLSAFGKLQAQISAGSGQFSRYALLAGANFTGVVTGLTAAAGTNTTQFATTAFVTAAVSSVTIISGTINGTSVGLSSPSTGSFTSLSASGTVSGSGFTSLLSSYATLLSPEFSGTPTVPTAIVGTSSLQAANTAYVLSAIQNFLTSATTILPTSSGVVWINGGVLQVS